MSAVRRIVSAAICGALVACSQQAATNADIQKSTSNTAITFKVDPALPWSDSGKVEVSVNQAGVPVLDADVGAVFYMAAIPSIKMPEMSSTYRLRPVGNGIYRGGASLSMSGTYVVTVTALRSGERLGSEKFEVVAK